MSRLHYFADGYLLETEGPVRQSTWVCIFNPSKRCAKLKFTFYYEKDDPTTMNYEMAPKRGGNLHLLGREEVRKNQRFGAKIESSEPTIVQITTGYYGAEDRVDWYTRGMHSVLCSDRTSCINYYADALVIDREGQRLKEPEWAFILNPNPTPAEVMLYAYYSDGTRKTHPFHVEPERVLPVFMDELIMKNKLFGAKYISDVPVAIQQTRLIEEEDRETVRSCFSIMAKPEPLPWQDESELTF